MQVVTCEQIKMLLFHVPRNGEMRIASLDKSSLIKRNKSSKSCLLLMIVRLTMPYVRLETQSLGCEQQTCGHHNGDAVFQALDPDGKKYLILRRATIDSRAEATLVPLSIFRGPVKKLRPTSLLFSNFRI